ncbi:MAG TPA: TonB-dependent receptor [Thermoanaerobaculia bacterium]|nr:TonB-dependent receptor [Thermoanaerobaculia bacterium]
MRRAAFLRSRVLPFGIAVLALALALPALAQTDVTTSRITGTVTDLDNSPLPGVSVEARNVGTGLVATAVTRNDGFYQLINLPPGIYAVTATLSGFQPAVRDNVRLEAATKPTVNFKLKMASVSESVTVTSTATAIETTRTEASTTVQAEQLKSLPMNGRNYQDMILTTPETRRDPESRGTVLVSGQRGINTNTTLDGMDYDNGFFGGTFGSAEGRAPLSLSQESIKEVSVIRGGASVEFGPSGGGVINLITKSGSNDLHGSGFYYTQPHDTVARLAVPTGSPDGTLAKEAPDTSKHQYGGSAGGPILRDHLFYFASYDQQKQNVGIPVNSVVLDPDIAARYPTWASDPTFTQTQDGRVMFGRLDYQLSGSQRIMARVNYAQYDGDHGTSSSQSQASGHNGLEGLQSHAYIGAWNSQWGASMLNDFNGQYILEQTPRAAIPPDLPEIRYGSFSFGSVSFLPITSQADRIGFGDTVTYLTKNQVIKGGAEYNKTSINQIFKGNWRGVYVFNGNVKANLLAGKWTQYFQFGGLNGLTADQAGTAAFSQNELALFAQDQWFITPKLTVTVGIRWEKLDNPDNPILNPNHVLPSGQYALDGSIPDQNNKWSPRAGLTYSIDPFTVARLSFGRFWARTPAILFAQLLTSNGLQGTQYTINAGGTSTAPTQPTDPLSPGWGANFDPNGTAKIDFSKVPNPTGLGVFTSDPNYKDPRTDRITLGFDRQVGPGTTVGIEGTYNKAYNLERLNDPNLTVCTSNTQVGCTGNANIDANGNSKINGQPVYSTVRPNPYYGRISTYTTDATSQYEAISLNLQHRFTKDLQFFVAATWSEDKDSDSNERNFAGAQAEDLHNLNGSYSWSNRDQRWRILANALWNTPWWGIGLSGSYRFSTGSPYTATTGADENRDGFFNDRPTVGGVHFIRNQYRQPDSYQLDFRLAKTFYVGPFGSTLGQIGLTAIAECFNCTNTANRFVTNFTYGQGQTPSGTFGVPNGVTTLPRTLQFAGRIDF